MDCRAGGYEKSLSRFQALVLQQTGPPLRTGIGYIRSLRQDGLAGFVPHLDFQFSRL
jgi:hypothetical protein